ncbi:MAG: MBL fold metallo-hydrolase [Bdellovibrionia bacterium]
MIQKTLVVGPFQCNCRIWVCPKTGEALVVDPGDEAQKIIHELQALRLPSGLPVQVKVLLHTHGHLDHIGATAQVARALGHPSAPLAATREGSAPVSMSGGSGPRIALHRDDEPLYQKLRMQGQMFGFQLEEPLPIDHFLEDEETLNVGQLRLQILHTPGHSPGSVCIRVHEDRELGVSESVLSGDTLFRGSVGRTDLWGANQDQMFRSIFNRILTLDGDTRVCPGHGPDTTIGVEKRTNPFLI